MDSFSDSKLQSMGSRRNKPSRRERYLQHIIDYQKKGKKEKKSTEVLNIYAELSKKNYQQIMDDELEVCLPYGVKMTNRCGSRGLFFECDDKDAKSVLIDGLEASGVSWQEN